MQPKISVILPVYNAQSYLAEAIDSILAQTFRDFELICIDDGSTDQSPSILRMYSGRDCRLRVVRRERQGLISVLNEGLQIARAPLVARMDADDISLPERLAVQYRHFELNPSLLVLGTAEERIDANGNPRGRPPVVTGFTSIKAELRRKCVIRHPSVMMRREPILNIGAYRAAYKHAEDYDLWLRVSEVGRLDNLEFLGLRYRMHSDSVSERHVVRQRISAALARATHELRLAGKSDPTAGLDREPDLWSDQLLDKLVPVEAKFFRFVEAALGIGSKNVDPALAIKLFRGHDADVIRANRRLWQKALVHIAKSQGAGLPIRMAALASAVRTNPGRAISLMNE